MTDIRSFKTFCIYFSSEKSDTFSHGFLHRWGSAETRVAVYCLFNFCMIKVLIKEIDAGNAHIPANNIELFRVHSSVYYTNIITHVSYKWFPSLALLPNLYSVIHRWIVYIVH